MRRVVLVVTLVAAVVAAAGPAHARRDAGGCRARVVRIAFDPRGTVTVTGDGRTLAVATLGERRVEAACAQPVTVSPPHTPKAVARRVTVTCRVRRPLQIEAHPIIPSGSQVIVSERGAETWLVTAVLKQGASRAYVFSSDCKVT
jgi:hypothetical protein